MEEQNVFNFILNDKIFTIPSKFPLLNDVDPLVLEILKTKKEYEVESNVSNDNFQSFLDNWVKKEPLNLTVSNYNDFDQLSQEFDRIKEHIELFNKFYIREEARVNKKLKEEVSDLQKNFKNQTIKYGQLIEYFCHKFQFISYSDFLKKKDDLYGSFQIENVEMIDVYGGKKVTFQDMWYSIDLTDKTAILLGNANAKGDVFIPRAVIYDNEEYVIKKMMNMELWLNITSLHFSEDSEIEKIESNCFDSYSNLKKIIVPPNVSVMESYSFQSPSLESIEFSMNSKLKELCSNAFSKIAITKLIVPPSVTIIRRYAFFLCNNLKTVEIAPNSQLKEIESFAFSVSPIEKLVLPSSVEVLKDGWSTNLSCIEIFQNGNENVMNYKDIFILGKSNLQNDEFDVLLFAQKNIEKVTIPSFVKCISKYSFANCKKLKKIEFEKDSKIEIIESNAYKNSSIESLSIPSSINKFEDDWCCKTSYLKNIEVIECEKKNISLYNNKYLMYKSSPNKNDFDVLLFAPRDITTAIIPEYVKKIASCAFQNCNNLKKVEYVSNSKLKIIGQFAFNETAIESFTIPCTVTKIDQSAFHYCNMLKNVKFEENSKLRIISKSSFDNTKIESIEIPSGVYMIKNSAFYHCENLKKVTFLSDSNLRTIGNCSFNSTALESVSIPSSVTVIKNNAFGNCENMEKVEFAVNCKLRYIESYSFSESAITNIMIPKQVIEIGCGAFSNCESLEKVEFHEKSELRKIEDSAFDSTSIKSIIIPPSVTEIEEDVFCSCEEIESVFIPSNSPLRSISECFLESSSIKKIFIPQNITKIGNSSFSKCENLKTVNFSTKSQLKSIGENAFKKSEIENISLPSCVEEFENGWCNKVYSLINITIYESKVNNIQFYDDKYLIKKCDSKSEIFNVLLFARRDLTKAVIPSFIIQIAPYSFQCCIYLTGIEFEKNSHLSEIENNAFAHLNIRKFVIPSTVKRIGRETFSKCYQLKSICFEKDSKLELIDPFAFKNTSITSFSIPSSCIFISNDAFMNCDLQIIEIEENSKLQMFNNDAFGEYELLMVPYSLSHLIKSYFD